MVTGSSILSKKLKAVLAAIDHLNSKDPKKITVEGHQRAGEQVYSERMTAQLAVFCPEASEELQIAARAQHVERWKSARKDYPDGKAGYYRWRTELGKMHAEIAAGLMRAEGFAEASINRVETLLTKKGIKQDAEVQVLEDVICLVFIQFYFLPFAAKHAEPKVIDIVQKTWKKMSAEGHEAALRLDLPDEALALIQKALN